MPVRSDGSVEVPVVSLSGEVRPQVLVLAKAMEVKLRRNDHKGQWQAFGPGGPAWFLARLREELAELEEAVRLQSENPGDADLAYDVLFEAADVANFAAMVADVAYGRLLGNEQ